MPKVVMLLDSKRSKILDIVEIVFNNFNLNWEDYLEINDIFYERVMPVKVSDLKNQILVGNSMDLMNLF